MLFRSGPLQPQPATLPAQPAFQLPPTVIEPQDTLKSLGLYHRTDPTAKPDDPLAAQHKLQRLHDVLHTSPTSLHTYTTYISAVTHAQIGYQAPHIRHPDQIKELDKTITTFIRQSYHLPTRTGPTYLHAPWHYYGGSLRSAHHSYHTSAISTIHNNLTNQFPTVTDSAIDSLQREFRQSNNCPRWIHSLMKPEILHGRLLPPLHASLPHGDHAIHTGLGCQHTSPLLRPATRERPPGTTTILRTLIADIAVHHVPQTTFDHFRQYGIHHAFFLLPSPQGQPAYTHFPRGAEYERLAAEHANQPYPRLQREIGRAHV